MQFKSKRLLLFLLLTCLGGMAQAQYQAWANTYSHPSSQDGFVRSIPDGTSNTLLLSEENNTTHLTKYSPTGVSLWDVTIGTTSYTPRDMAIDSSGNVYITGGDGTSAITYKRRASDGALLFTHTLASVSSVGSHITIDGNGSVYTCGLYDGGAGAVAYIVKLNSSLVEQWNPGYVLFNTSAQPADIQSDSNGDVYLLTSDSGSSTVYKINPSGTNQWNYVVQDPMTYVIGKKLLIDNVHGFVYYTGSAYLYGLTYDWDFHCIKLDRSNGFLKWSVFYDKAGNYDQLYDSALDSNGNIIGVGYTTYGGNSNATCVKWNAGGGLTWARDVASTTGGADIGRCVAVDSANNIYMGGQVWNSPGRADAFIIKLSGSAGIGQWFRSYDSGMGYDFMESISVAPNLDVFAVSSIGYYVDQDLYLQKLQQGTLTISPSSGIGGTGTTATMTLNSPAPAGGYTFNIASSSPALIPTSASLNIAAGATSNTLALNTTPVATNTSATLTASIDQAFSQAPYVIVAPAALSIGLSPSTVQGGSTSTGTVTLTGPAPTGGMAVLISSNSSIATLPPGVLVSAGSTTQTFTINTTVPVATQLATISVVAGGVTKSTGLLVLAPAASSVTTSVSSVTGGTGLTGTVTLTGPAPSSGASVTLTTTAGASVSSPFSIAGGATFGNFGINTTPVAADTVVTLTAVYGGASKSTTFTVLYPRVQSLTINPGGTYGGLNATGTVTLNGPAPTGGKVVTLSSNSASATVPPSLTVSGGLTSSTFTIRTSAVSVATNATVTATTGATSKTANLAIRPPVLQSIVLIPDTVKGGNNTVLLLTLTGPAPAGGATIVLSSAAAIYASLPPSVVIPAGSFARSAVVTTQPVATNKTVQLNASTGGAATYTFVYITP